MHPSFNYHTSPINLQENAYVSPNRNLTTEEKLTAEKSFRMKLNQSRQNQILNRKLSSVLDASPLKNSMIGKIIHDRYQNCLEQPDGQLTLETILNETLFKLKSRKNNKAFLKPLNVENQNKSALQEENIERYNSKQRMYDSYVKDGQSINLKSGLKESNASPKQSIIKQASNLAHVQNPSGLEIHNIMNESVTNNLNRTQELKVEDQIPGANEKEDFDALDELTEQDRFFLI